MPLAIQRQIFSVVVPLVLLFLCAIFWVVWCVLRTGTSVMCTSRSFQ